uniref:Uncharacterized protein n=1 Tax=Ditylenchus dipsaci TaxID=166011 RepID=A0A915D268_9BILA
MPNQHLQKFMLTLVGNLCDLGQPRTNDFHSTRPISQLNDPKTGEELEAKSVKDLADKVKADVAGINKKLGEYTKTTDALNTLIGTMETAIDAGIELKKEAYRVLHKAEDAGFDAKTAEEAATKVKTDANTAAKTAEAKIAEDAETTDKNAGADISGQITTAEELKSLASAAKQACADAVKKTPALSSKLATGPQLAEDALNSMKALLSAAGEISKAIDAAINSRKKATDLFAPFAAIDRKDKADKLEKATQQQAQTLLQQDIQEREKAANQELFLQMQQIPISAGRPEEQAPIKQEISSVVNQNDQQKLVITDAQGPVIPLDENGGTKEVV